MITLKKIYKSRTMRVAMLVAVLGALEASSGLLRTLLPEKYFGIVMIVIAIIMALLRVATTVPLSEK
jgi:uncharacterized membrane protein YfcA